MKKSFLILIACFFTLPLLVFADGGSSFMMAPWTGMMSGGFFFLLSSLIWLVVGVLAAIWLWQHIDKK